ncbi:glutaredoxin family protein [Neobacillus terrae]|uniref:glutaredoxin family protein n=1 Tax=Neobacillus terrae TaxID=3034837 RepID=UPI001FB1957A|nr:glutaredoxin family protein [Neobacillus terrae]
MNVIVYSTNDCIECEMVKKVLTEEGIPFMERNVSVSPEYQKEVEQLGFLGVPVTVYQDLKVKGFTNELKALIEKAKTNPRP